MKAFIVVAFLVASVAARSLDVDTLRLIKEKSLLNKGIHDDLLLNTETLLGQHRFQLPKKTMLGDYPLSTSTDYDMEDKTRYVMEDKTGYEVPTTGSYGQRRVTILSLEEILQTSLFREYYNIPLFRQFWEQYPSVFQRYVQSVLFQQFWTVPAFQQYFRNPVLFYKYIVPQVQVYANTHSVDIFNRHENNFDNVDQYLNKNEDRSQEVVVGDYLNQILSNQGYNSEYTVPYARGYPYGQQFYGKNTYGNNQVNYKFLLDKIFKTLFVNQGEVTQVRTDVKIAPAHKNIIVEPMTGESKVVVEEPRIVDVKVVEKTIPSTEFESQRFEGDFVKETLLKKLLLKNVISHQVYQVLMTLPIHQVELYIREHVGQTEFVQVKETLLRELLLTKVITPEVYEVLKTFPIHMIQKYVRVILGQDRVHEEDFLVKETLLKKYLLTNVISREVYEILKKLPVTMIEQYIRHYTVGQTEITGEWETPFVTRRDSRDIFSGLDFPRFQEQTVESRMVKQTLLKKLLLTNVISRQVYEVLKTFPIHMIEKYVRVIVGEDQVHEEDFLVKESLLKKYFLTNVISREVYEILKKLPVTMIEQYIRHYTVGQTEITGGLDFPRFQGQSFENRMVKETLLKKLLLTNVISREVYEVLITLPYHKVIEYVRQIVGDGSEIETPFVTRSESLNPFVTRRDFNNRIFNTNTFGEKTMYNKLYNNEIPTLRDFLNIRA